MELVKLSDVIDAEVERLGGKSKAMNYVAKRLNTTVATLYRWISTDDHFLVDERDIGVYSVFKLVKCVEK